MEERVEGVRLTFVFEKVAHAGPTSENELSDVFDNLCFLFTG